MDEERSWVSEDFCTSAGWIPELAAVRIQQIGPLAANGNTTICTMYIDLYEWENIRRLFPDG